MYLIKYRYEIKLEIDSGFGTETRSVSSTDIKYVVIEKKSMGSSCQARRQTKYIESCHGVNHVVFATDENSSLLYRYLGL